MLKTKWPLRLKLTIHAKLISSQSGSVDFFRNTRKQGKTCILCIFFLCGAVYSLKTIKLEYSVYLEAIVVCCCESAVTKQSPHWQAKSTFSPPYIPQTKLFNTYHQKSLGLLLFRHTLKTGGCEGIAGGQRDRHFWAGQKGIQSVGLREECSDRGIHFRRADGGSTYWDPETLLLITTLTPLHLQG